MCVTVSIEEPSIVVVIHKHTEGIDVLEFGGFFVVSASDAVHALAALPDILDCEVHRVVEEARHVVLVVAHVVGVSVEALSDRVDAGGLGVLRPEILGNLGDCVDPDSVKAVALHDALDPVLQILSDVRVFLSQIWQISKSAVLNLLLVVPVRDLAVVMIVFSLVQGVDLREIHTNGAYMVGYDVDHHPDAFGVSSVNEVLQVLF